MLKAGFNNEDVIIHFLVREIMMTDYYRHEASQAMVGYASSKMVKTEGINHDDYQAQD